MIISYGVWFVGKLCANWLMERFSITKVMIWYCLLGTVVLILTATIHSPIAIWGAVATSFFFGPVYPTIYAHGLDQVTEKQHTETGGAFVPVIMGRVSDLSGSMQLSFIVPAIGFALILWFFLSEHKKGAAKAA